jgi:hypothetical protein
MAGAGSATVLQVHAQQAALANLQGIKIHFRKFLYEFCVKRNKLLI